jgi:hypothetical protein
MTKTITIPDAEEQLSIAINKKARASEVVVVDADQKYAIVLLPLANAVQASDYPALKVSIEAIPGIQSGVKLLVDHRTTANANPSKQLKIVCDVQVRREDIPQV